MSKPFSKKFLEEQRKRLLEYRARILNGLSTTKEEFQMSSDDLPDEGDLSQAILTQNYAISLRERDVRRLREIDEALHKMDEGTYGYCEESGEPIGQTRLEKIPWTKLSIESAEELERQGQHIRKHG